jgi:4-diphosphocytidyl-2-C-methyl-D-erythritol kinase
MFGTDLDENDLCMLASKIGSDCPFFIHGHPALMGEKGEKFLFDVALEDRSYLLICPGYGISTAKVYSNLNIPLTEGHFTFKINEIKNKIIAPESFLLNELECSAFKLHPELKAVKDELTRAGALGALMTGSGSSVFGVFKDAGHLENAMIKLRSREGYRYIPTTRTLGGINGDYRS